MSPIPQRRKRRTANPAPTPTPAAAPRDKLLLFESPTPTADVLEEVVLTAEEDAVWIATAVYGNPVGGIEK
ncbi:hypothetical protein PG987_010811 [Apiospora arundinis]